MQKSNNKKSKNQKNMAVFLKFWKVFRTIEINLVKRLNSSPFGSGALYILLFRLIEKPDDAIGVIQNWKNTVDYDRAFAYDYQLKPMWEMVKKVDAEKGEEFEKYLMAKWESEAGKYVPGNFVKLIHNHRWINGMNVEVKQALEYFKGQEEEANGWLTSILPRPSHKRRNENWQRGAGECRESLEQQQVKLAYKQMTTEQFTNELIEEIERIAPRRSGADWDDECYRDMYKELYRILEVLRNKAIDDFIHNHRQIGKMHGQVNLGLKYFEQQAKDANRWLNEGSRSDLTRNQHWLDAAKGGHDWMKELQVKMEDKEMTTEQFIELLKYKIDYVKVKIHKGQSGEKGSKWDIAQWLLVFTKLRDILSQLREDVENKAIDG